MEVQEKRDLGKYVIALSAMKQTRFPLWSPFHKLPSGAEMKHGDQVQLDGRQAKEEGFREFRRNGEGLHLCRYISCPFEKRDCDDARFVLLVDDDTHEIIDSIEIEEKASAVTPSRTEYA